MSAAASPVTDLALVTGPLYGSADRLARRTGALHRARVSGPHAGHVIADLAGEAVTPRQPAARIADIGCGRGTTTAMLTERLPRALTVAIEFSPALLAAARHRLPAASRAALARADFRWLPLGDASCDVIVAAFCLYHCADPGRVIREIARCLLPGGTAILVTKSAGRYRELDHLVAASGLDPHAVSRPSLYQAAHTGNLPALASPHLRVRGSSTMPTSSPSRTLHTPPSTWPPPPNTSSRPGWPETRRRLPPRFGSGCQTGRSPRPPPSPMWWPQRAVSTGTASATHRKRYRDTASREQAEQNYRWLAALGAPLRLPPLLAAGGRDLVFEHVDGRHAGPGDLIALASHLGALHARAHAAELHRARLARPLRTRSGHQIPGFPGTRLDALARNLCSGSVPRPALTAGQAERLLRAACDGPAAFYRDASPRNYLITPAGPVTVDFDDLTLAPSVYDLAKLVVTLAMTHGPLPAGQISAAIDAYNAAARTGPLTWKAMTGFAEIHHILTARYVGAGGYRHTWDTVRPSRPG
jgi:SAM-dependent methyltransferase